MGTALRNILLKIEPAIADRLFIQSASDRAFLRSVQHGIVFIHATWSGPSVLNFKMLTRALLTADPLQRLQLIVADLDKSGELYALPETTNAAHQTRLAGNGESLWIRNGTVVRAIFLLQPNADTFVSAIQELQALK